MLDDRITYTVVTPNSVVLTQNTVKDLKLEFLIFEICGHKDLAGYLLELQFLLCNTLNLFWLCGLHSMLPVKKWTCSSCELWQLEKRSIIVASAYENADEQNCSSCEYSTNSNYGACNAIAKIVKYSLPHLRSETTHTNFGIWLTTVSLVDRPSISHYTPCLGQEMSSAREEYGNQYQKYAANSHA